MPGPPFCELCGARHWPVNDLVEWIAKTEKSRKPKVKEQRDRWRDQIHKHREAQGYA